MKFSEILKQASELLRQRGRLSYRTLRMELNLEDEQLDVLKEQLIDIEALAVDQDGKMLVWVGQNSLGSSVQGLVSEASTPIVTGHTLDARLSDPRQRPPIAYTPAHLAERIRAVVVTDGERKTITALFADLKGSTTLIEGLDPEEAQAIIDPALQLMMDAVHQYEGYVAQALGDGIFALFGAPLAHEDHPQRALYAALRMQEAMRRYTDSLRQQGYPPLLMRVGLNTGEVVLRSIRKDDLHADYVPVGHSTNLAARMEQLATPGAIVVSAYTHRLTDGYFAFKDLGLTQIKGVADSLNIYEVLGVGQLRTRLQVSATRRGLTRFVGRQNEMEQLHRALEYAKAGHGQIVGTMGEPGLGKSRLFYEFKLLSLSDCLVLEAYSVSHGKASAYLPVIELLKTYFRIEPQDDERTRREKVGGKVLMLDRSLEDTLPYLFALLSIEEQPSPLQQMDPQIRRRRTLDALKKLLLRESLNQLLVLIFEDLHWIDGETQGFLDALSESVASARLLLLTNYRPEYRHEWGQKTYYTQLQLAPLGTAEAEEFLDVLLGTTVGAQHAAPLQALKQLILDKTQGTPFFIEEIVQELREQGVLSREAVLLPTDLHIPTTVQAVLAARIDRLAPDEKTLLQQLSVVGRQFPVSLIRQVITQPETELYRLLASLQRKEFLYEQPAFPEVEYIFKHALTQDVAYNSVLQERRKVLHEQTGHAIEQLYKENLEEHYNDLAHHYQRSGNTEKAIEYLHKAGQQAVKQSANTDAAAHFNTALALLKTLPETEARQRQELILQLALGAVLMTVLGQSAPETGEAFQRAQSLSLHAGDIAQRFLVLAGLRRFYGGLGEVHLARDVAQQMLTLAEQSQDSAFLLEANQSLANVAFWSGEFPTARGFAEGGLFFHDPQHHRFLALQSGIDPGIGCYNFAAITMWFLGYPDQALERSARALAWGRKLGHPYSQAFSLIFAAFLHYHRREGRQVQEHATPLLALATEHGFALPEFWGTMFQGWALTAQRQFEEGLSLLRSLAQRQLPPFLGLLLFVMGADALRIAGEAEEGLHFLEKGAAAIIHQPSWEAELYRLKGELLLMQADKLRD